LQEKNKPTSQKNMIKSREKIMKMIDRDRKNEIKKEARKNIMIFVNKIHIYATGVTKDLTLNILNNKELSIYIVNLQIFLETVIKNANSNKIK